MGLTALAPNELFSQEDLQQLLRRYEQQTRISAAMAQLQARTFEPGTLRANAALQGVPDFPPEPNDWQSWVTIPGRYAEEAFNHFADSQGILVAIPRLLFTDDGQKLLARLKDVVINHKDDPALFAEFMKFITLPGDYGSLLLGVVTEAGAGAGIVGLTGVAIPTKGEGKVKWFSGLERSKGLAADVSASFLIGRKVEQPQDLTGQFYGYHAVLPLEPVDVGSSIYFDTSDALRYKGFITTFGIGLGIGTSILWGWELVTSD